jgi:hypothetical protein
MTLAYKNGSRKKSQKHKTKKAMSQSIKVSCSTKDSKKIIPNWLYTKGD